MSALAIAAGCTPKGPKAPESYPQAPTDSTVTDTYFDLTVADPYRPLENDTAAATLAWAAAENEISDAYINAIPFKAKLRERMGQLANYKKTGLPWREKTANTIIMKIPVLKTSQSSTSRTRLTAKAPFCSTPTH